MKRGILTVKFGALKNFKGDRAGFFAQNYVILRCPGGYQVDRPVFFVQFYAF
jgi:hypothetical protein